MVGVLLVRRGGYAVGVFSGRRLTESKVGSAYVQGRTKAGGWSQQRFARRRANQARGAYGDAADVTARILLPRTSQLAGLSTGGDKPGLRRVLADPRLESLRDLVLPRILTVPDPRLSVLAAAPDQFLAVRIRLNASA
jgi:peptide subunit release factor 1 (eRF1)